MREKKEKKMHAENLGIRYTGLDVALQKSKWEYFFS